MKPIKSVFLIFLVLMLASCANNPLRSYKTESDRTIMALANGNPAVAGDALNSNQDVLYHLENGSINRMNMDYPKSEDSFKSANAYVDAWAASYHNGTLGSISDTLQASLINDNAVDYQVKDYEKVMLISYRALNALNQGDWQGARIQIQRMYQLEEIIKNYREEQYQQAQNDAGELPKDLPDYKRFAADNKNNYNFTAIDNPQVLALKNGYQNAFSHYLAGFVFEALDEISLSRPGYVKALQLNPANSMISHSIANLDKNNRPNNQQTDLLLIEEVGHAPQLKSYAFNIPFPIIQNNGYKCLKSISVSFPGLVADTNNTNANSFAIDGNTLAPLPITNINLMAARYLHDNLPNIFIRNMLRVSRDMAIQHYSCEADNTLLNIAAIGAGMLLNHADERTWVLLPSQIYINRIRLAQGRHTLKVRTSAGEKTLMVNLTNKYQIISWRVIDNQVYFSPDLSTQK